MTTHSTHPHAAFDRYPDLLQSLTQEFGSDGIHSTAALIIDAELADFCWDARFAEMNLGPYDGFDGDEEEGFEAVAIIGFFRDRYYVATCSVDRARHVDRCIHGPRYFDNCEAAIEAFLARRK